MYGQIISDPRIAKVLPVASELAALRCHARLPRPWPSRPIVRRRNRRHGRRGSCVGGGGGGRFSAGRGLVRFRPKATAQNTALAPGHSDVAVLVAVAHGTRMCWSRTWRLCSSRFAGRHFLARFVRAGRVPGRRFLLTGNRSRSSVFHHKDGHHKCGEASIDRDMSACHNTRRAFARAHVRSKCAVIEVVSLWVQLSSPTTLALSPRLARAMRAGSSWPPSLSESLVLVANCNTCAGRRSWRSTRRTSSCALPCHDSDSGALPLPTLGRSLWRGTLCQFDCSVEPRSRAHIG